MGNPHDVRIIGTSLYFLPVETRVPLKFGAETLTSVTCARASVTVEGNDGRTATGWGETPLSVQWAWPSSLPYAERFERMKSFCKALTKAWAGFGPFGHALEIGHDFKRAVLSSVLAEANLHFSEPMPWLAALICCSPFDLALHDGYGTLHDMPVYATYGGEYLSVDLSAYLEPATDSSVNFIGRYPQEFLAAPRPYRLRAWHLVGGLDRLYKSEITPDDPDDGYPIALTDWIERDGLKCLKIKLRGIDSEWDYDRVIRVGSIAISHEVEYLSVDFNCTVTDPEYVNDILDRLAGDHQRIFDLILYVEQPFPYDLEMFPIDVRSVSARKPLFMDESAHEWTLVRLGRERGWTGVALKTCKTQTGAILSLCWAKAHGMDIMVQDLTNPMLAQIPHVLLAAHAGTIMGVETNAMQFYPEASNAEAAVHPGLYIRRGGEVDLSTVRGPGFGYRLDEISRELPPPVAVFP